MFRRTTLTVVALSMSAVGIVASIEGASAAWYAKRPPVGGTLVLSQLSQLPAPGGDATKPYVKPAN